MCFQPKEKHMHDQNRNYECPELALLVAHMSEKGYRRRVIVNYKTIARQFLRYLRHIRISIDAVQSEHVQRFMQRRLSKYRRRHGRSPSDSQNWRAREVSAIRMLLRMLRGKWPPLPLPRSASESMLDEVLRSYDEWMREIRGLCLSTRENRIAEALRFMKSSLWIDDRSAWSDDVSISDIDAYVASRTVSRRTRASLKSATVDLRSFLRYLKISGRIKNDLSSAILVPKCYKLEDLPRELHAEHVDKVLEVTRADYSALGRRDYAILTLLATYGLRAGEVIGLRLEDIDWKNDILRVRRGKSGAYAELPLLPHPGNAILAYLQHGRPKTGARQVFVRTVAPYGGLAALTTQIRERLAVVGATSPGRRGPHAFRHAQAASLLRGGATIKEIGDVLGHRSTESTAAYLRLATDDLRTVALNMPVGVAP
jgi:integrase/recombinase XerD